MCRLKSLVQVKNPDYGGLNAESFPLYATALAKRHVELEGILRHWGMPEFWGRRAGIDSLFLIILQQQISIVAAKSIYQRVSGALGGLSARRVYLAGPEQLRSLGLTRQKSRYFYELASAVVGHRFSVGGLKSLSDADAISALCVQSGIGPWTAAIYLMSALKRIDVWPPGDLALRRGIADILPGRDTVDLADSGDRWEPHRAVAARLVWHHYRCSQEQKVRS